MMVLPFNANKRLKLNDFSSQYKKCFAVVEMGGGVTALIEDAEALKKASLDQMTQDDSIVMQPNPERASQSFATSVQNALDKVGHGLKFVLFRDFGTSFIFCQYR